MSNATEAVKTAISNKSVLFRRAVIVTGTVVGLIIAGAILNKTRTSEETIIIEGDVNIDTTSTDN